MVRKLGILEKTYQIYSVTNYAECSGYMN